MGALRYTQNIPIMCHIGQAFALVALDIFLFLAVMFILFIAFALLFYSNFRLVMNDFSSFGGSLFYIFKGLQGEMDSAALMKADPYFGPVYYAVYVTVMLYV